MKKMYTFRYVSGNTCLPEGLSGALYIALLRGRVTRVVLQQEHTRLLVGRSVPMYRVRECGQHECGRCRASV